MHETRYHYAILLIMKVLEVNIEQRTLLKRK
jgi:hypothetical protein